jgi:hypothetical protein
MTMLRACWVVHSPSDGRDAQEMHPSASDLHHEQHVQAPQGVGVDVEEIGRQQPGCLRS